ncbi:ABC transporter permease [Lichenicoccus roseus]|uniref:ABC transporter permease n=1 Tax=Lichenicoccus roseus TaxID=2683649 RepID=A0A5R9J9K4_9PROT|nr:ABC transporter permease [Lichenicoccus roseus]TLU70908.1 ABC transporter permease [Lichenicoccus roseus]
MRRLHLPGSTGLILPACVLGLWEIATASGEVGAAVLPPPLQVVRALIAMASSGELMQAVGATIGRLAGGFLLGAVAGTVLGALSGASGFARRMLDPTIQALRSVPSLAWVPLFILWLGIFEASKISLIAVGVFFPIYLNLMSGIAGVDRKLLEVGRVHGLSRPQCLLRIQLPAALPSYIVGLRSELGLGWMFVSAAELLGASSGLGFVLDDGEQTGRPERILAAILLFGICGKATDLVLAAIGARLVAWQDTDLR